MIHISRRRLVLVMLVPFMLIGVAVTQQIRDADLRSIRSRLPFMSTHDFLYRREPRDATRDKKQVAAAFRVLMELESSKLRVTDLVRQTSHRDPEIRALALLGLVAQESREVIPSCIRLVNDSGLALPLQRDPRSAFQPDARVATEPQKVGQIARGILKMVKCRVSFINSQAPEGELRQVNTVEIAKWWADRKDNPDWLTWYEFLYLRASQGSSPLPKSAGVRIARFRKQIDTLPTQTRAWLLLYLADDIYSIDGEWHDDFASMQEMLDAAKGLGSGRLISFLKDGQRRGLRNPGLEESRQGQRFVIKNAIHLFRKKDAPALLELKQFTAAADADPTTVRRAVDAGMRHFTSKYQSWDRGRLMAALAVHGDGADRKAAATWFYNELSSDRGSSAQSVFIGALQYRRPENWREIIRPIVAHSHFDRLKPLDVVSLALLVQRLGDVSLLKRPIYGDDSILLGNELRRLFKIPFVESKTLTIPKVVLPVPVWSRNLATQAHSLAVSNDGKMMAIGMDESKPAVHVVDARNGQLLHSFNEPSGRYFRVEFVSSQKLAFAPSSNNLTGNLLTWTVGEATHRAVVINRERDHVKNTRPQIIPSRRDGRLALLDTESLGWFENSTTAWRYKKRTVAFNVFEVSPDASWIAINDGVRHQIELIATQDGRVRHALEGLSTMPARACFSPDSKRLIAVGQDNRLILWNTETGKEVTRYLGKHARFGPVDFNIDGSSFFAAAGYGHVGCFSTTDGSPQFAFPFRVKDTQFNANGVLSVVPSPDGRHLFALMLVREGDPLRPVWSSRVQKWDSPRNARK